MTVPRSITDPMEAFLAQIKANPKVKAYSVLVMAETEDPEIVHHILSQGGHLMEAFEIAANKSQDFQLVVGHTAMNRIASLVFGPLPMIKEKS